MAERLYRPGKAWWREVAELDHTLFERGTRDRRGLVGILTDKRVLDWDHGWLDFRFSSSRSGLPLFLDQTMGSSLLQVQKFQSGGQNGYSEGTIALTRRVNYIPAGVYGFGNHGVKDRSYIYTDVELIEDGLTKAEDKELLAIARRIKREQDNLGFTKPTEETYVFILNTLKQGEGATRQT